MVTYTYNKEEDIFYVVREGLVSFDDLIDHIKDVDEKYKHKSHLCFFTDARKAVANYKIEDFFLFIEELKKRITPYNKVYEAVIVDQPLATAYGVLFSNISKDVPNYHYEVFSSKEGAKEWLLSRKQENVSIDTNKVDNFVKK